MRFGQRLIRFWDDQDGTASLEYLVVLGLIVVAIIGVAMFGQGVLSLMQRSANQVVPVLE